MTLSGMIKQLEDIMRTDSGIDGTAQRLSQIVWLLFLKVFDESEMDGELLIDYEPVIPEGYCWRDWANPDAEKDQTTGEELIDFVNNKLFPVLRGEPITTDDGATVIPFDNDSDRAALVRKFMTRSHNYAANGIALRNVVNLISTVDLSDVEQTHEFNNMYETLLKSLQSAGRAGEFYTPRAITQFAVRHVNPQIGDVVADYACGTGGFLVDALRHLEKMVSHFQGNQVDAMEKVHRNLIGGEFKPLPYMLCVTNLLLNDVDYPRIRFGDSLTEKNFTDYDGQDELQVDCIVMNPPYGGIASDGDKRAFPADLRSSETADLFMAMILGRLRQDGRAAVVLPDGFLFGNDGAKLAIKKRLLRECNLHTIIRLPESVFAPYTSITTNILFFDKTHSTQETWFYRFDKPEGYKHFSKTKPLLPKHMEVIDEWWENRVAIPDPEVSGAWKAQKYSVEELEANGFNFDLCGYPHEEEEILPPDELIADYRTKRAGLDQRIDEQLDAICKLLGIGVDAQ